MSMFSRRRFLVGLMSVPAALGLPILGSAEFGIIRMKPGEVFKNMAFVKKTLLVMPNCVIENCRFYGAGSPGIVIKVFADAIDWVIQDNHITTKTDREAIRLES